MRDYEAMWAAAGRRASASVGSAAVVAILGDDPAATRAMALGVARAHAQSRRVFVFDLVQEGLAEAPRDGSDESLGVSDMVHFGVSLGKAARASAESPNLFVVAGGAESPLSEDILSDRWWGVIADQVRRAGGLLLIAAPSIVPGIGDMVAHADGVFLVGDAESPNRSVAVLAEVRASSAMRAPIAPSRPVLSPARSTAPSRSRWRLPAAIVIVMVAAAAISWPRWRPLLQRADGDATTGLSASLPPIPPPLPAAPEPAGNEASYSVELLFTNSSQDALQYIGSSADSLPATTFAVTSMGANADPWYRLIAGAFPDSASADSFLVQLRTRGRVATGAGTIARTPFALLLDSASTDAIAQLRLAAYRGRGIPAYVLRDSAQVWRVYAGAFQIESDAQLLKQQLDSLNIQSALVMRAGSTP